MSKTHYRRVFKSDHLGVADLEDYIEQGRPLIFTIKEVKQYLIDPKDKNSGIVVAGKRTSCNIAYFNESDVKPMVINSINSKRISSFNDNSSFVDDWANTVIELYIDENVKLGKDTVGGFRVKTQQPKIEAKKKPINDERFSTAFEQIKSGNFAVETLRDKFDLTEDQELKLKEIG